MKKIITLLFLSILTLPLHAVVILVHGTFALHADWCSPGGEFYEELEKQAHKIHQKVVPFLWSGALGDTARIKAGRALTKLILSYPDFEEIILIGHSHGGNVINIASQLLAYEKVTKDGPVIEAIKSLAPRSFDTIASAITQDERRIKYVFFLGTPVAPAPYVPAMSIIENVFNMYSIGDTIQNVFGFYATTYPPHERITNVEIRFDTYQPGHTQLHEPIIARWILLIPKLVKTKKSDVRDGTLCLSEKHEPTYIPIASRVLDVFLSMHQDQLDALKDQEDEKDEPY